MPTATITSPSTATVGEEFNASVAAASSVKALRLASNQSLSVTDLSASTVTINYLDGTTETVQVTGLVDPLELANNPRPPQTLNINTSIREDFHIHGTTVIDQTKEYLVTLTITNYVSGTAQIVKTGADSPIYNANGIYEFTVSESTNIGLRSSATGLVATTMLSIKEVQAQTVTNLLKNGDFASDTEWTKQAGWTISGGNATSDGSVNNNSIRQTLDLPAGTYELSFDIVSISQGAFRYQILGGGVPLGENKSTVGTHTFTITPTAPMTRIDILSSSGGAIGSVDNVILRSVS